METIGSIDVTVTTGSKENIPNVLKIWKAGLPQLSSHAQCPPFLEPAYPLL
jgi:hypothetical protein